MSNSLAIASVTETLRWLLSNGGIDRVDKIDNVTVRPLDKAPEGIDADKQRINLFLYQVLPDAAFRNMDMPGRVKSGETGHPPLPLILYYLLTAYSGNEQDETKSHALLGKAMRIFHDHPFLGQMEISKALGKNPEGSDLADQAERIRITLQPLLFEEMSKLWTTFQIHYRLSAAYQVSVVLIESTRPTRTPLPVLTRGIGDRGVMVQPDLTPPFPTLTEVTVPIREPSQKLVTMTDLPKQQPTALLGDELLIKGHHLHFEGDSVFVHLVNPLLQEPVALPMEKPTASELKATIPDDSVGLVVGIYTLSAKITRNDSNDERELVTNTLAISLAPKIVEITQNNDSGDTQGTIALTIRCSPQVRIGQRVALLLGNREVPVEKLTEPTDELKFRLKKIVPGTYFVRLRIDGVDSLLVDWSRTPPEFDATKKVTVQ